MTLNVLKLVLEPLKGESEDIFIQLGSIDF